MSTDLISRKGNSERCSYEVRRWNIKEFDGGIYFPGKVSRTLYKGAGENRQAFETAIFTLEDVKLLNRESLPPSTFELDIPLGTVVYDRIVGVTYEKGGQGMDNIGLRVDNSIQELVDQVSVEKAKAGQDIQAKPLVDTSVGRTPEAQALNQNQTTAGTQEIEVRDESMNTPMIVACIAVLSLLLFVIIRKMR